MTGQPCVDRPAATSARRKFVSDRLLLIGARSTPRRAPVPRRQSARTVTGNTNLVGDISAAAGGERTAASIARRTAVFQTAGGSGRSGTALAAPPLHAMRNGVSRSRTLLEWSL